MSRRYSPFLNISMAWSESAGCSAAVSRGFTEGFLLGEIFLAEAPCGQAVPELSIGIVRENADVVGESDLRSLIFLAEEGRFAL